jgi:hemolysin activation/secretion protein
VTNRTQFGVKRHSFLIRLCLASLLAVAIGLVATAAPGLAQTAVDAANVEERFRQAPELPRVAGPMALPKPGALGPIVEEMAFVLTAVVIEGVTIYDAADLAPLYEPYLAQRLTTTDIEVILAEITNKYRDDGYFLAQAVAPPQALEFGIVTIRVIEGYIEKVTFGKEIPGRQGLLDSFEEKLRAFRPIRLGELERYVLLMNDLPGVQFETAIRALDSATGAYELVMLGEADTVNGYVGFDNRGTRSVGQFEGGGGIELASILGLFESTRLNFYTIPFQPRELLYFELQHEQVLGPEGTRLWARASRSVIDGGAELDLRQVEDEGTGASVGLRYPVIRNREESLYVEAAFSYADQSETEAGSEVFDDRLWVGRLYARYLLEDTWMGSNYAEIALSRGFGILNASSQAMPNLSRIDGRAVFTKVTLDVSRYQGISNEWGVYVAAMGQYAANPLLSAEEFRVGGARFGRAYNPSEISGDDGAALLAELQYGRFIESPVLRSFQLYGYYDIGAVWDEDLVQGSNRDSASSTGIGARLSFVHDLYAGLEVAYPVNSDITGRKSERDDPRAFFYLSANF